MCKMRGARTFLSVASVACSPRSTVVSGRTPLTAALHPPCRAVVGKRFVIGQFVLAPDSGPAGFESYGLLAWRRSQFCRKQDWPPRVEGSGSVAGFVRTAADHV